MARRLVLASGSSSRLRLLRLAGIDPEVIPSGVDETAEHAVTTAELVLELAERKALAVAEGRSELVLGCDSLLELDGEGLGKPGTAEVALRRWAALRGREATLRTGHFLIDAASGRHASEVVSTTVRFGSPSDAEIAAYVATGEPLEVAGAFTLEGRSGAFIDAVFGDATNVMGLSLAALRRLLGELEVSITELWAAGPLSDGGPPERWSGGVTRPS